VARGQFQRIGDFDFDCIDRCLWFKGQRIELGTNEGKLLAFLVKKHGEEYENIEIEDFIWPNSKEHEGVGARLSNSVSLLRRAFGPYADEYISRNKTPVRLIKTPRARPWWYRPDSPDDRPRLTPRDPQDEPPAERLWTQATDNEYNRALHDYEWAWISPFHTPLRVSDFYLTYADDAARYEESMPPLAKQALHWWRENQIKKGRAARVARLEAEPIGLQVRFLGMRFAHELGQRHHIELAPAKFLHYVAIQQNLWAEELHNLRQHVFENALRGINTESDDVPPMLPCTFAIHMAAISSDNRALLRQRDKTPIYPLAWEAGLGELMHGPKYARAEEDFSHFNEKGEPDLSLYLRNTVKEELSYKDAKDDDFLIYGIAAEWRTLAPKLVVVYQSDASIDELIEGAQRSPERPRAVSSIDVSADGISESLTSGQYPTWGPTSKLALLLALVQRGDKKQVKEVQDRMDRLDPEFAG